MKKSFLYLKNIINNKHKVFYIYILFYFLLVLIQLFILPTISYLLTSIINNNNQSINRIIISICLAITVYFVIDILVLKENNIITKYSRKIRFFLQGELNVTMMEVPFEYTEDSTVLNKLNLAVKAFQNDTSGIQTFIINGVKFISYLIFILIFGIILCSQHVLLGIVFFLLILFLLKIEVLKNKTEFNKNEDIINLERQKDYYYEDMLTSFSYAKDFKINNIYHFIKLNFLKIYESIANKQKKYINQFYQLQELNQFINLLLFLSIFITLYLTTRTKLSNLTFLITLTINLLSTLPLFLSAYQSLLNDQRLINYYILFLEEYKTKPNNKITTQNFQFNSLEFKNVFFKYPTQERYIFENLNFKIEKQQMVGIVGRNGAGKSTMIKLISRLYKPTSGTIYLNGVDINLYSDEEYQNIISVVFQDSKTFPFTVKENISFDKEIDKHMLDQVLEEVYLKEKVESFSDKENTYLVKGVYEHEVELSGGMEKNLLVARTFYSNAPIYILDEPTSAMNIDAEMNLYELLSKKVINHTIFLITHRLQAVHYCDVILVFDQGKIIQQGDYPTLINQEGLFKTLYEHQSSYYKQEGDLDE